MTHRSLSTYLMWSVLIILSGILWIIFTQVDRSYDYSSEFSSLQQEHSELVQKVYQLQPVPQKPVQPLIADPIEVQRTALAEIESKNAATIKPATESTTDQMASQPPYDEWDNPAHQSFESAYALRNNPWSPDYQPGL